MEHSEEDIKAAEAYAGKHIGCRYLCKGAYLAACEVKNKEIEQLNKDREEEAIRFEMWRYKNQYTIRRFTHPNKVNKYFSDILCDGYYNLEELYQLFKLQDK